MIHVDDAVEPYGISKQTSRSFPVKPIPSSSSGYTGKDSGHLVVVSIRFPKGINIAATTSFFF